MCGRVRVSLGRCGQVYASLGDWACLGEFWASPGVSERVRASLGESGRGLANLGEPGRIGARRFESELVWASLADLG